VLSLIWPSPIGKHLSRNNIRLEKPALSNRLPSKI
jgi:hypothetical protein